nr:hypothetical protein [Tanacetum cinerariifolium]
MIGLELQPRGWHSQTLQFEICTRKIHHFLVEVNLGADTASTNGFVCLYSEKDVSNDLNLSSKRNAELNIGRLSRIMLGIIGGGIGASLDVVIIAIVEGVIIGVGV